jgi:hypothetical protein
MKRVATVASALALVASIGVGCSGSNQGDEPDSPSDAGTADSDTPIDVEPDTPDDIFTPEDTRVDKDGDSPPPDVPSGEDGGQQADGDNGSTDSDFDGLTDEEEAELCGGSGSNPNKSDTDGDGLGDYEEYKAGTSPCKKDTDGDGATDYQEVVEWPDLNPTNRITYNDGILDGNRWILTACETNSPAEIGVHENNQGNWKLALPTNFQNYTNLTISGSSTPTAAAVYDNTSLEVGGFTISRQATGGIPSSPENALSQDIFQRISNAATVEDRSNGAGFDTHGGFRAATGEYTISPNGGGAVSVRKIRETLLPELGPFSQSDLSGLPNTSGSTHASFKLFVTVVLRPAKNRTDNHLIMASIAPYDDFTNDAKVEFRVNDLTNPTNIAEVKDTLQTKCTRSTADEAPPVTEFYWVIDQTSSMGAEAQTVKDFSESFAEEVSNTGLDYRFGVTNMDSDVAGRLKVLPGWHTQAATFNAEVDQFAYPNCTYPGGNGCSTAEEDGLYNAREGLKHMLGLGSQPPQTPEEIRANANVMTIIMSDDNANTVRDNEVNQQAYNQFFDGKSTVFSIVDLGDGSGGQACSESAAVGSAYKTVSQVTGGKTASICGNLTSTISDIIETAAGQGSKYPVNPRPITPSLKVFLDDQGPNARFVPRSSDDGFKYFAEFGSVAFFGDFRPEPPSGPNAAPDRLAVSYYSFKNECKESDQGAFNCINQP